MKDFLTLWDYSKSEILGFLEEAARLKQMQKQKIPHAYLQQKILALIFTKSSTRTRVSFEAGMMQLGGQTIFLSSSDIQLGRGETIYDTAKVLSRYVDGIMIRTFAQADVEELAQHTTIPVINGLTDTHHPCQVLADLFTIKEYKGGLKGCKLCFIGDGNNVANSLLEGCVRVEMDISIASPDGFAPSSKLVAKVKEQALKQGTNVTVTNDPVAAIKQSDIIYTDVWASMGQEEEQAQRLKVFKDYQINKELCSYANADYLIMHCLPAHRGEEITTEILDGEHSVIFDQAENRLHAQKALLKQLIK